MGGAASVARALVPLIPPAVEAILTAIRGRKRPKPKELPPNLAPKVEDKEELIRQAQRDLGMDTVNKINIAVVGNSGVGKSSLVNALLGLRNKDPGAAPVGVVETTMKIQKYQHPQYPHIVMWDIPGAGTLRMPALEYFQRNKLWGFDALLIVSSDRFVQIDFEVCKKLHEFKVPCVFVRNKADISLYSLVENGKAANMKAAASMLREQVRFDFQHQMEMAKAPLTGLYIVCANAMCNIQLGKKHNAYMYYDKEEGIHDESLCAIGMDENALFHFVLYSLRPRLGL